MRCKAKDVSTSAVHKNQLLLLSASSPAARPGLHSKRLMARRASYSFED